MKLIILSLLTISTLLFTPALGEKTEQKILNEKPAIELAFKTKENVVALAIKLLQENKLDIVFAPEDYDITIWSNENEVLVHFRQLFRFYPQKNGLINLKTAKVHGDFTVNLTQKTIFNSEGDTNKLKLPKLSKKDQNALNYVKNQMGIPFEDSKGLSYEIYEERDFYNVFIFLHDSYSNYLVDKSTGKISWVFEQFCEVPETNVAVLRGVDPNSFKQIFK